MIVWVVSVLCLILSSSGDVLYCSKVNSCHVANKVKFTAKKHELTQNSANREHTRKQWGKTT